MQQIIYASRPFGFDASVLANILATARERNARSNVTGALICRPDIYIQLLEGPVGKVEDLFERIQRDDRHTDVQLLVRARIEDRLFPDWAMKHDPSVSWLWSKEEIDQGALRNVSARDVRSVFVRSANADAL